MKSALGPFVVAIVLALGGGGLWLAGHTETQLADVHKQLATLHYADAQSEGSAVEQALGLERRVPMLGKAAETDARDVRAAAGYWRSDYAAIAPQHDANGVITETDPAILLLNANAAFRASQAAGDRLDTVRRLDNVVKGYAEVLKAPACGAGDRDATAERWTPRSTTSTRFACATCSRNRAARRPEARRRRSPRPTRAICPPARRCTAVPARRRRRST